MNAQPKTDYTAYDALSKIATWVIVGIGAVALIAAFVAMGAVVIWVLWGWFVIPLGAPSITIPHAAGLALLLGAAGRTSKTGYEGETMAWLGNVLLKYATLLAVGYVVKHYFM